MRTQIPRAGAGRVVGEAVQPGLAAAGRDHGGAQFQQCAGDPLPYAPARADDENGASQEEGFVERFLDR
ncbi:hypothetical protein GCM10010226_58950 [Streptomyces phaeofaciens]|uniref:Uncharacterized protein n=1 Tax=Streptomyces phaeofaciens TaxID=68254 RepID=A0A918HKF3_9ACTN|nr:hypothetical protein GCM10010226_58950 [Streptomyces phaeofaciens]